jgi:hypothetical protein
LKNINPDQCILGTPIRQVKEMAAALQRPATRLL